MLDNFEHLLDGATLVSEILGAARDTRVLATSRERLNLGAETVFGLTGMSVPAPSALIGPLTSAA